MHVIPTDAKEGISPPRTEDADSSELPCGSWELNPPGPLEEQSVL